MAEQTEYSRTREHDNMFNRRDFLKAAATASCAGFSSTVHSLTSRRQETSGFFGVHPFVEKHPEAG
jgi:hypothetical protein